MNLASRAQRISDFLSIVSPGQSDTIYDLGCGNVEQVSQGALRLAPHRLDFADVMVLRSAAFA